MSMQMDELIAILAEQQERVERKEIDCALSYWDAMMDSTPDAQQRAAQAQADLEACYADSELARRLRASAVPGDPDLARQRKLLLDDFERYDMPVSVIAELARREIELDTIFANFRADFAGISVSDNDLRAILRDSGNSQQRQEAWRASKQIGIQAAPKIIELVELRNREATRRGYPDYYTLSIRLQELDEDEVLALLDNVSAGLENAYDRRKHQFDAEIADRFGIAVDELRPWHYSDPFFQEAPTARESPIDTLFEGRKLEPILTQFFTAIGLDIGSLLSKADLYERPGKNQHAYCLSAGRGTGDIRVNCNLRSDAKWMGTLLHEFGHAVYDNELDPDLPFFLRTVSHTMTTEAIAEIMGRFVTNAAWLKHWAQTPSADIDSIAQTARDLQRTHLLVFTQWVEVITHFERELYRNPAQDLDALWWMLVEKYQKITAPKDPPPHAWAAKIHLATSPVYYHNYLLGEMIASQILAYLRANVVSSEDELVQSPAVGRWLIERFFRPGNRYAWNDHIEYATGEKLNPRYFIDEIERMA